MKTPPVHLGSTPFHAPAGPVGWAHVTHAGQPWLRVTNVDAMPPFFMSVVSDSDPWLFVGSNGAFVGGRVQPDSALFPYLTVDRILERPDSMGARTALLVRRGAAWALWEPWQPSGRAYALTRTLYKHAHGTAVVFEETNHDLGLRLRSELTTCEDYGLLRLSQLAVLGDRPVEVRLLDGWHQLQPPGLNTRLMAQLSYLAAAYMRHERVPGRPLGLYTLNARLSDLAEPAESLRAAAGWVVGLDDATLLLSDRQIQAFRRGEGVASETEIRGAAGACYAVTQRRLQPGEPLRWIHGADTELDHAAVVRLRAELADPIAFAERVRAAAHANHRRLLGRIAAADGLQQTADAQASVHHFANVLFNCMRGGTLAAGYGFPRADLQAFLASRSRAVAARHAAGLAALPDPCTLPALHAFAAAQGDPALARLANEYLPLTFSRRHGDPSRPWNRFAIRLKDAQGQPRYTFEGNWRDIFQNWEALATSHPGWLPHMISVFLNASTADGYNPYRVTREGIDWEVPEPDDEWGGIGYWGDHQIIYLLRLLEADARQHPGRLAADLNRRSYAFAEVPYEIAGFDGLVADPRHSIHFNEARHAELMDRAAREGGDGKLLHGADGQVARATLAEKLLVPLLAKLTNLVPGGGVWLNTQRPEWNDANNALAGWGLSVVTVAYMRRYLAFCRPLFAAAETPFQLAEALATAVEAVTAALRGRQDVPATVEALGRAGEAWRARVYARDLGAPTAVPVETVLGLLDAALAAVDATLRANRRDDGLYHAYNTLALSPGHVDVGHLDAMLEGQVAILSAGLLGDADVLALLKALRASDLYRADQHSYLLYPDRQLTPFTARNTLAAGAAEGIPLLKRLLAADDRRLVIRDADGQVHFQADLTNARDVRARLEALGADPADGAAVLALWEDVFNHRAFTGRSSTFFAFEGLGSIYWHMVAKLLLAVQECHAAADAAHAAALAEAYDDIRAGLGFMKTPEVFGAIPTDPYSHSPRHLGAQQPGMTGQVKEEVLTRLGELGVTVQAACLQLRPRLLHEAEFDPAPEPFVHLDLAGQPQALPLPPDALAFTVCQVPVCYRLGDQATLTVRYADGSSQTLQGDTLSAKDSAHVFARDGAVCGIVVQVPRGTLRP